MAYRALYTERSNVGNIFTLDRLSYDDENDFEAVVGGDKREQGFYSKLKDQATKSATQISKNLLLDTIYLNISGERAFEDRLLVDNFRNSSKISHKSQLKRLVMAPNPLNRQDNTSSALNRNSYLRTTVPERGSPYINLNVKIIEVRGRHYLTRQKKFILRFLRR